MMPVDLQNPVVSASLKNVYEFFKLKTKFADCVRVKGKLNRGKMISQNRNLFSDRTGTWRHKMQSKICLKQYGLKTILKRTSLVSE